MLRKIDERQWSAKPPAARNQLASFFLRGIFSYAGRAEDRNGARQQHECIEALSQINFRGRHGVRHAPVIIMTATMTIVIVPVLSDCDRCG
jgi:hypothetical protein